MLYKMGKNTIGTYGDLLDECAKVYIINRQFETPKMSFQDWVDEIIISSSAVQKHIEPNYLCFDKIVKDEEVGKVIECYKTYNNINFHGDYYTNFMEDDELSEILDDMLYNEDYSFSEIGLSEIKSISEEEEQDGYTMRIKLEHRTRYILKLIYNDEDYVVREETPVNLQKFIDKTKELNKEFLTTEKEYQEPKYRYIYKFEDITTKENIDKFLKENWDIEITRKKFKK